MKILSIETSCDETAISIIEGKDNNTLTIKNITTKFEILGNALLSQIDIHKEYGGVFPSLAKREHGRNLVPILKKALAQSLGIFNFQFSKSQLQKLEVILKKEPELLKQFLEDIPKIKKPDIDAIAVTNGPGLEPALWVGVNFAKALSLVWNLPIVPINHMEGHIFSALMKESGKDKFLISNFQFPILALLISGGHTQLILSKKWLEYEIVGETIDDAVGEAFDKTARMLNLPYPGGPEISKLAEKCGHAASTFKFPRPMIYSNTCDFSFSGLKTSILYTLKKIPNLTEEIKQKIAKGFEDAVVEVLETKTKKAIQQTEAQTLVIGGGVSANKRIREVFEHLIKNEYENISLYIPYQELSTDNAIMIAVAGYFRYKQNPEKYKNQNIDEIKAEGNLRL